MRKNWIRAAALALMVSTAGCAGMARSQAESAITVENHAYPKDYTPEGHTLLVVRAIPQSDGTIWEPDQDYLDAYNEAAKEAFVNYAGEYKIVDYADLAKAEYQDRKKYRFALIATVTEMENFDKRDRWLHTHLRDLSTKEDFSSTDRQTPTLSRPIVDVWVERLSGRSASSEN